MENYRKYGRPPYRAVVLHGGPGAPGCAAGLCRGLENKFGILEHLQRSKTIDGLIEEIFLLIQNFSLEKTVLIGHSFGAWLALLFAERYPGLIAKVIIIGCGPFEQKYLTEITDTRKERLEKGINTDLYCPLPESRNDMLYFDEEQFKALMEEIFSLRIGGGLLSRALRVSCPVLSFHGDFDPHPIEGVRAPLEGKLRDFRMIVLQKCGHDPWKETYARERFFILLTEELGRA